MPAKYTSEEIIKKINQKHNNTIYVNKDELVDCQTSVEFTCNICGYKWKTKPYSVIAGHGCRRCYDKRNSKNRITPLNVLNEKLKHSGCNAQIIGEYIDTKHKALAKCDKCGNEWRTNPNDMLRGHGCPKCNDEWEGRRKTKEQFMKEMNNLYNGEYIYIIDSDYVRTRDIIKFICSVHGEVEQLVETHIKGGGCKFCSESKGEKYIRNFLIENNIKFIPQFKKFDWLKTNKYNSLSFDFYLTDYNIAIEVQGKQHFEPTSFGNTNNELVLKEFELCKERDLKKKKLSIENNVTLVYYLDKKFEKYMNPDEDIYFTDKEDLLRYILSKPKILKEEESDETSNKT